MLCDEIIETYTRGEAAFFRKVEGPEFERVLDKIRRAHKFVFNERTTGILHDVKDMKPSGVLALLDFAKPPYGLTWLEFPQIEFHHNVEFRAVAGKPPTKRIGFLVEQTGDGELLMTMGYSFRNAFNPPTIHQIRVSFRHRRFSEMEENIFFPAIKRLSDEGMDAHQTEEMRCIVEEANAFAASLTPKEKACAQNLDRMFVKKAHPAFLQTLARTNARYGVKKFDAYMQSMCNDWHGDEGIPLFAFAFLSCRNVFEVSEADISDKLNRARVKRGKEPFFSYHMVDLKPEMKSRLDASANTGIQQRRHWVRGHFKERKTGRFFWHPHLAGNPDLGFVAKDYKA